MSELLSKISSYNLYNYLLVGFVYNMLLCHYDVTLTVLCLIG